MINLMSAEQELVYSPYVAKFQQPMESEWIGVIIQRLESYHRFYIVKATTEDSLRCIRIDHL
jgi:hypothetical protein